MNKDSSSAVRFALHPLQEFLRLEAAGGIVLVLATAVALGWANSPWAGAYRYLWALPLASQSVHFWINDGLMTFFFLLAGLEIRREMHEGALSTLKLSALPLAAAVGGVVIPALIYLAINHAPALRRGWAVPTATDIAFAVGVLAVLGKRVPSNVRILLLALAIIDDIAAIFIIAFFYSGGIHSTGLLIAGAGALSTLLFQRLRVNSALAYLLPGAIVWLGMLKAGIHPTLAGVTVGLLTPISPLRGSKDRSAPVERVEAALHPWVTYGIMPLFALANAGMSFRGLALGTQASVPMMIGIILALVIGKPLGIVAASALTVKLGLSALPAGITWRGMLLVGGIGGIGFTMSIFIANLAFPTAALLATSKLAVLIASTLAAVASLTLGVLTLPNKRN